MGEHSDTSRADEVIGYIVIESGSGSIGNLGYVAGVGAETVVGPDNGPPVTYPLSGLVSASSAVVSSAGMNGLDGGWAGIGGQQLRDTAAVCNCSSKRTSGAIRSALMSPSRLPTSSSAS